MTQRYLRSEQYNKQLLQDGYIIVPFLNEEAVKYLTDVFYQHHPITPDGMYATSHNPNTTLRKQLSHAIASIFVPHLHQYFHGCTPLGGSFIAKTPGKGGYLAPHQDWNLVDEKYASSFNVWVPLTDTSPDNGGIFVLQNSHKVFNHTLRGPNIPSIFSEVQDIVLQNMTPLYIKAGEALIYDHRLVHASPINHSNQLRLAIAFGIIPQNTSMLLYFGKNQQEIDVYASNTDFFFSHNPQDAPTTLVKLHTTSNTVLPLNKEQFFGLYHIAPEKQAKHTNFRIQPFHIVSLILLIFSLLLAVIIQNKRLKN